jgi:integrase
VTLAAARATARECREQLLAGLDPVEQRRAQRASNALADARTMTFDQCRDAYIAAHRAGWRNVKHAKQWTATLTTYVTPIFGNLSVAAIDIGLVLKVLEPMWAAKSETASRVRGRIEVILDWAKVRGYRIGENPARWRGHLDKLLPAKSKVRKVEHHPALPYGQIGAFISALREREGTGAKALQFTILTVARTDETISMRGDEIDMAAKLWTVPPERMKGKREHRVPLSEPAMAIIREMMPAGPESVDREYVFNGAKPGRPLGQIDPAHECGARGRGPAKVDGPEARQQGGGAPWLPIVISRLGRGENQFPARGRGSRTRPHRRRRDRARLPARRPV